MLNTIKGMILQKKEFQEAASIIFEDGVGNLDDQIVLGEENNEPEHGDDTPGTSGSPAGGSSAGGSLTSGELLSESSSGSSGSLSEIIGSVGSVSSPCSLEICKFEA